MWITDFGLSLVVLYLSPVEAYANLLVHAYLIIIFLVLPSSLRIIFYTVYFHHFPQHNSIPL